MKTDETKTDTAEKSGATEKGTKTATKPDLTNVVDVQELLKQGLNDEGKSEEEVQSDEENQTEEQSQEEGSREGHEEREGKEGDEEHKGEEEQEQEGEEKAEGEEADEKNEDEEESEDDGSDRKKLSPELQKVLDKRIGKEVGKRKALQDQLDQANAQIEQLKTTRGTAPANAAPMLDEATIDKMEENGERLVNDIEAYLDESAGDKERGRIEKFMEQQGLDAVGLKAYARKVQRTLTKEIPKERERLKEYRTAETQANAKAKVLFPFLAKKDDPLNAQAAQVLELFPEIKRLPHWQIVQGAYVLGLQQLGKRVAEINAQAEGKKKDVKAPVKPPKKLPVNQPPPKKEVRADDDDEASEKIAQDPSSENVMAALKAGLKNM